MHFKYIRKFSNGAYILSLLSQIICFNFKIWKLLVTVPSLSTAQEFSYSHLKPFSGISFSYRHFFLHMAALWMLECNLKTGEPQCIVHTLYLGVEWSYVRLITISFDLCTGRSPFMQFHFNMTWKFTPLFKFVW